MAKTTKPASTAAPKTKVTTLASPKVDPNAAKVYEAIARNIKESARDTEDLNDISKDLSSTWSDMAKAITLINKNSDILGDNFDKVTQLTKNVYSNIQDVGSEYFKQVDTAQELTDIVQEQLKIGKKLAKEQKDFKQNAEDITDLVEKRKKYEIEANKEFDGSNMAQIKLNKNLLEQANTELDILDAKQRSLVDSIKLGTETKTRLKHEREVVFALDKANTILNKANEHAEKLGFNFESAANTVTGKLEKSFAFMDEIPFLSDIIGLDSIKEKIEKNVKDSLVSSMAAGKGPATSLFSAMTTGASTLIATMAPLLPLIIAAAALYKAFEFDKELTQFSKDLDVSKDTAMGLSIEADAIAGHLGVAGVNGVEVGKAMATIHDEMGTTAALADKELVGAVSLLQTRIGLSGEEAMALNSTATMLGTTLNELAASSYDMADGLIGGKAMLKEMAKLPKSLVAGFKGTTQQLQKAIVKGKLFGLTIEQASKAGESMLDIESSIEKEMTANVLTGKHMNLNRARQLALTGSQAELQDEILKQAGSLEDYQKMSPLQQKAMSDALGLSSEEMANMLTKSEEMRKVGLSQVKVEEMMTGSLEEQQKNIDGMSDAKQKSYLQDLLNKKKQEEATAKFQDSMTKLTEAFQKTMMPVVELLGEALGYIGDIIHYFTVGIEKLNHWIHSLSGTTETLKEGEGVMSSILSWAAKIGAAILLWNVGKKALGGMASMVKNVIPGMGGGSKTPETPDTSKMDKAKGKGSEGGLTSLAGGLKAMGQSGITKGILNTALAGPALLLSLPSIPFLAFIGKVKLDKLEENFTGLGNGLKAMDGTFKGVAATGAFGIAGGLALVSIPFLLVFGKVKLDKLQENFMALGTGLQSMSGTMMGSAGLGAFALAGALAIPSLIFLGIFGKVSFGSLLPNFTGLAEGLMLMSPTLLGSAALAAFGLAAIIAIPSLIFLGGIALLGAVASSGLIALGTGLASLGAVAATGLPFIAVGLIAALGLAMIPFGIALAESAPGIKAFAEVLGSMGPIIIATFEGIGNVIDKISGGIALIITTIATSIKSLADLDPLRLLGVAGGIGAVGLAIAGFGAGAGAGGVMSAIGSFFDEDPVEKFNRFAAIDAGKLVEVAGAIDKLGDAIAKFGAQVGKIGEVTGIIDTIDKVMELQDAVEGNALSDAVEGVGNAVGDIFAKAASFVTSTPTADTVDTTGGGAPADSAAPAGGQGSLTEVAGLLKQLIAATSQPVKINIGGRVIDEIEKLTTLRKTYSATVDKGYGTNG
jgi:hypothetical protein